MITEGFFRRHVQATGGNREVALLDVAQDYILEYLRREGAFDSLLVFKGGTALRKFVFGAAGRFSVDLDFGLRSDDPADVALILDLLDGAAFAGVAVRLERRRGPAANLRIETTLGPIVEPAAVSIRSHRPWLPAPVRPPLPFEYLDRGLVSDFTRAPLPVLDVREIAAEKIAAFRRRRKARDLYDLEHLGRALQADFDGPGIAALAALKIYFDVVDEGLGPPPASLAEIFAIPARAVSGTEDLGHLRAAETDVPRLLAVCAQRYAALATLEGGYAALATAGTPRDRWQAIQLRDELVTTLTGASP
jgi:predicted nucleotidyltransferase component of viral defense system